MTQLQRLKTMLKNDEGSEPDDEVLEECLDIAHDAILNRRFPFGYSADQEVEPQYKYLQIQCAISVYNKMGAEGEGTHIENGITRVYSHGDIPNYLLEDITPMSMKV